MKPEEQKCFDSLSGVTWKWSRLHGGNRSYFTSMAGWFMRMFQSGLWLEPPTISSANSAILLCCNLAEQGRPVIPESMAVELLAAVESYTRWAKTDPRWKSQYQHPHYNDSDETLKKLPGRIISAYPNIRKQRAKKREPVPGAVAIRGSKPDFPGAPPDVWMSGSFIVPRGDVFFIPSLEHGILELDARSLAVKRLVKLPRVPAGFLGGFARNDDSFMVNLGNRLFVTLADGDGGAWSEVEIPEFTGKEGLNWRIEALGSEFFVGSCMNGDEGASPLLMAGKVRDGKLTWLVASNRRPAVGPLDEQEPRDVTMAFRGSGGIAS